MLATTVCSIDPGAPAPAIIATAAQTLRRGGLVAFPTETVYGLGANALDTQAVARIFAAKGRPANNPLIVHVADLESARCLAAEWPDAAVRLVERFWPGPLTLVVKKTAAVPAIVTADGPTVALRSPAHKVALAILAAAGIPIAAPSANRSSRLSPTRAEHVRRDLEGHIDILLDAGPTAGGLESTVLDVSTPTPRLLRPGLVSPAEIEAVIGPIERPHLSTSASNDQPLRSPGLIGRHYSPRTRVECIEGNACRRVDELSHQGLRLGWINLGEEKIDFPGVICRIMPRDVRRYAAEFYAVLHDLDAAGLDCILVELPPRTDEWLAIHDRLRRM